MDAVSAVLDGHRAQGAFVLNCAMTAPWAVAIADRAAVALLVVHRGELCLVPADAEPVTLRAGDAAIIKNAAPYRLADGPATPAALVVEPGQVCRVLDVAAAWPAPTGRTWGNDPAGACGFVVGVYELPGQVSGRLLGDLPGLMVVRADDANLAAIDLLVAEVRRDAPGQALMLDRLVDLLLVDTLRSWLTAAGGAAPGWWRADGDPVTGGALRLIHDRPEHPWTLAALAAEVGVSRATLARRFTSDVGTPPLAYLTEWRLGRAADLLRTTTQTVEHVARQVGYANPFAFSTAFKRRFAHSPRDYRRTG